MVLSLGINPAFLVFGVICVTGALANDFDSQVTDVNPVNELAAVEVVDNHRVLWGTCNHNYDCSVPYTTTEHKCYVRKKCGRKLIFCPCSSGSYEPVVKYKNGYCCSGRCTASSFVCCGWFWCS